MNRTVEQIQQEMADKFFGGNVEAYRRWSNRIAEEATGEGEETFGEIEASITSA